MLPSKIDLEIVTPERRLAAQEVDEIVLPGSEGSFGVLPGHAPLLASLGIGELVYRSGSETSRLAVSGGFVEVLPDRVSVLAHVAERGEEIDVARAEKARERAQERLRGTDPDVDFARAQDAMRRSLLRLGVATQHHKRPVV